MKHTEIADELDRIAYRLSETLYYASGAIKESHTKAAEKFIRHEDYDRLRSIARELRGPDGQTAHELGRSTLPWAPARANR